MRQTAFFAFSIVLIAALVPGCAITDYDGWTDHKTSAEAKLWGKEVAFTGFGADLDGTYAYTVKYDNRPGGSGKVTINSYRNEVPGAFSRESVVDRDGDDVQGNAGSLTLNPATPAGKFLTQFVAVDENPGCQFGDNVTQDKSDQGAGVFLCINGADEEIDADFDLHAAFSSLDDLFSQIWSGVLSENFTMEVNGVTLNGVHYPIASLLPVDVAHNGTRPARFTVNNGPGAQALVDTILANTQDGVPVSLGLTFDGGLSVNSPGGMLVGFNHAVLQGL